MLECEKYRVELWECPSGCFNVSVKPVIYLGKDEFKRWTVLCNRNFMRLTGKKPWSFTRVCSTQKEAESFAKGLTSQLDELVFFDHTKNQVQIVTPKEA